MGPDCRKLPIVGALSQIAFRLVVVVTASSYDPCLEL